MTSSQKCTDSDMLTFITTVHQILTGVQTAETEEDRFSVTMRAVYGQLMWK